MLPCRNVEWSSYRDVEAWVQASRHDDGAPLGASLR
jgi:hypothetical protein